MRYLRRVFLLLISEILIDLRHAKLVEEGVADVSSYVEKLVKAKQVCETYNFHV